MKVVRNRQHATNVGVTHVTRNGDHPWKSHLSSYGSSLSEITFASQKNFRKAVHLLWTTLSEVPYDLTGGSIIVPDEAVPYFEEIGKLTSRRVSS